MSTAIERNGSGPGAGVSPASIAPTPRSRRIPRALARPRAQDAAASEVVGFIIMFLLSTLLLIVSMNAFFDSKETSDDVVTAVELEHVAARVASRVLEASVVAQDFPNATYEIKLDLPPPAEDRDYRITLTSDEILVVATKGNAEATTTTYNLDAVEDLVLSGEVYSYHKVAVVRYELVGTQKTITLEPSED